jgi:hypothetical protein
MRTYSRDDFLAAREEWKDFDREWEPYRKLAAEYGMLYPPAGTKWDSWEDEEPSQRAIIYRAIEDTPDALTEAIRQSHSWFEVVRKLMADIDRRREDATYAEKDAEWERQKFRGPMQSIGDIFNRFRDSMP